MNKEEINPINIYSILILVIPISVFLGIRFFIFHIISFILFCLCIVKNKDIKNIKNIFTSKEFIGIAIYLISMIIALIVNPLNATGTKLLSPIYLMSFWIMGLCVMFSIKYYSTLNSRSITKLSKYLFFLGIATIVLFVISTIYWNVSDQNLSGLNGFLYYIIPEKLRISFFYNLTEIKLIFSDYGGKGWISRFNGFEVYQVASATVTVILAVYSYIYLKSIKVKSKFIRIITYISYYLMLSITLYFNRSRTIFVGVFLAIILTLFIKLINKKNYKKIFFYFVALISISILIAYFSGIIENLLNIRPNSNRDRMFVYSKAIETFKMYPIFGVGVRYFVPESAIPIGSHSTYLGVLMRSGIVGFVGIVIYKASILISIYKNKEAIGTSAFKRTLWNVSTFVFVFISIFMILEDIDWPSIVAFLYFVNVAIIISFNKIKSDDEKKIENLKISLVGSSGGHLTHLMQIRQFWENKDRFWVTFEKPDAISQLKDEKIYWCYYPTNRNIKNLLKNTYLSFKVIIKEKPDVIISSGAAVAIPFFYVGKLFNVKLIYIEVYDRIDTPTVTGKLVYPICDEFIVQWEEQLKFYPNAKMIGGLF